LILFENVYVLTANHGSFIGLMNLKSRRA